MAFSSWPWTGREPGGTLVVERPPVKSAKLEPRTAAASSHEDRLAEYAEIAAAIGVAAPDMAIENFKTFLRDQDIPVFSLSEVVAYMDDKAAKESKEKCGWEWHPLRAVDHVRDARFGRSPERTSHFREEVKVVSATDFYLGPHMVETNYGTGQVHRYDHPGNRVYDKTVPLHALRKVALIGKAFGEAVKFMVCDYALAPAIQYPDPFLMAVVPNSNLDKGVGRFVIDFWDEPGFGIEQQLK
jgi:hypothetical protein